MIILTLAKWFGGIRYVFQTYVQSASGCYGIVSNNNIRHQVSVPQTIPSFYFNTATSALPVAATIKIPTLYAQVSDQLTLFNTLNQQLVCVITKMVDYSQIQS